MNKKALIWALPVLAMVTAGCKNQGQDAVDSAAEQQDSQVTVEQFEMVTVNEAPIERPEVKPSKPAVKATPAPVRKPAAVQRNTGKAETIYVETDGAQGRVWGHVTMRGDRGSGTIHDWDENTLTVTVTRHGNELFAVDQNSRQYVFRLNK
jgi:hypothetical protein